MDGGAYDHAFPDWPTSSTSDPIRWRPGADPGLKRDPAIRQCKKGIDTPRPVTEVHHVDRQQKTLAAIRRAKVVGHRCFPSAADQGGITRREARRNHTAARRANRESNRRTKRHPQCQIAIPQQPLGRGKRPNRGDEGGRPLDRAPSLGRFNEPNPPCRGSCDATPCYKTVAGEIRRGYARG